MIINIDRRQVADFIARKLGALAQPADKLRNDISNVQVDQISLLENYTVVPAIQFKFEIAGGFGMEVRVRIHEFAANPKQYMADLLENMAGIHHAAMQRRTGHQAAVSAVYSQIKGAAQ